MVKHNKIITNLKVFQVHIKTLLNKPYIINVANIAIPSYTFTQQFFIGPFMSLKMSYHYI
jgi:hypothetical protein